MSHKTDNTSFWLNYRNRSPVKKIASERFCCLCFLGAEGEDDYRQYHDEGDNAE